MPKYTKQLADALTLAYERMKDRGGWRSVSREFFDGEIPFGTLNRIAKSKGTYLPAVPEHLEKLHVPYSLWPINALIKKQLLSKSSLRKKKARRSPKRIQQMTKTELLYALKNRTEM